MKDKVEIGQCTMQHAVHAVQQQRYHSNQKKAGLFIAENAIVKIDHQEDSKLIFLKGFIFFFFNFFILNLQF